MTTPHHIAIIPDGNRRWAKQKGLPSFEGHKYAFEELVPTLIDKTAELGIKYFTLWLLSTENLRKRSKLEIEGLLNLGRGFFTKRLKELKEKNLQLNTIGDLSGLPTDIQKMILDAKEDTKKNTGVIFTIGLNYGGRNEIIRAVKKIMTAGVAQSDVTQQTFSQYLDTPNLPDPDLIIRTGGEFRLSGFMPWQSEYSELYFSKLYFPDFTSEELEKAVNEFSDRQRRYGQ